MGITLQFVPYVEIENLSSPDKIKKLLGITKENKVVVLQGRLKAEEEGELIKATMESIDEKFKGVELGVIYPENRGKKFFERMKLGFANFLLGERTGLTIIGPATVVKEIKRDPNKIQLMTKDPSK